MAMTAKTRARQAAERKSTRTKRSDEGSARSGAATALALLEEDHREVQELFEQYEDLRDDDEKAELAEKICLALTVHTHIEEEIFYPHARKATKDDDLLDEALVEHAGAKHLIAEIEAMDVGDELYDAKIRVLGEQVRHHIKEEETELFPEVEKAKTDLVALGKKLAERKEELMSELPSA
jgi:Hemerythrin HHE cation binding domain